MKNYLLLFFLAVQLLKGQIAQPDCVNAFTVQSGFAVAITNTTGPGNVIDLTNTASHNISNPSTNPIGNHSGCLLTGEPMPSWYIFKICNTGTFQIIVGSNINQYQQAGFYDWSLWKYTSTTCAKIMNNQLAPLRCNWNASNLGGTGICDTLNMPPGGVNGNYEPVLTVNAGDSLIMCINNYSAINYIIDFLSVGTSSIGNCAVVTTVNENKIPKQKAVLYNSNSNKIELLNKEIKTIAIHDTQGKEIYKNKIRENDFIDCSNFARGLYFLTYYSGNETGATEKILIH